MTDAESEDGPTVVLASVIEAIGCRAVIECGERMLGPHPYRHVDADLEGVVALIDWRNCLEVVATGSEAVVRFMADTTPIRALGAAMLASARYDALVSGELPLLSGLALGAKWLVEHRPGLAPADEHLRWGLAARAVALDALGAAGDRIPERVRHSDRPGQRLGLEPADQWTLDGLVHLQLAPADRAALGASC